MDNTYTDITVVLDRSGSMASIALDTIGGFNTFLDAQKKVPGKATLTLVQFDNLSPNEVVYDAVDIQKVTPLSKDVFIPRGGTPLYDAVGTSIISTGIRLSGLPEDKRPGKVIVVIITDGEENASREFSSDSIKEMIQRQTNAYSWEFIFLAANQDAITSGAKIGVSASNSMSYLATGLGVRSAFTAVSDNAVAYRKGTLSTMAVTSAQRVDAMMDPTNGVS